MNIERILILNEINDYKLLMEKYPYNKEYYKNRIEDLKKRL